MPFELRCSLNDYLTRLRNSDLSLPEKLLLKARAYHQLIEQVAQSYATYNNGVPNLPQLTSMKAISVQYQLDTYQLLAFHFTYSPQELKGNYGQLLKIVRSVLEITKPAIAVPMTSDDSTDCALDLIDGELESFSEIQQNSCPDPFLEIRQRIQVLSQVSQQQIEQLSTDLLTTHLRQLSREIPDCFWSRSATTKCLKLLLTQSILKKFTPYSAALGLSCLITLQKLPENDPLKTKAIKIGYVPEDHTFTPEELISRIFDGRTARYLGLFNITGETVLAEYITLNSAQ